MAFYNRNAEQAQLSSALRREKRQFIVVYGRRRAGKSTLLRRLTSPTDVYFQASQTTASYQRERLTEQLAERLPGLADARFTGWSQFFSAVNAQVQDRFTLVLDEFPYLVKADTSLPSVLQRLLDDREQLRLDIIICGSSQQMMRGLILSATAPLYGRADEIIKLDALAPGWLLEHLPGSSPVELIEEYATWGGIPRYWELRKDYPNYADAVKNLILSPTGVLHEEPNRLLLEDLRDTVQSATLLTLVAAGVHRLSELGARMQKPATDLSRPLQRLIEMGYLQREIPYGAKRRATKLGLYKVADPFLRFHYHYVHPNLSELLPTRLDAVWRRLRTQQPQFLAQTWENLCRDFVGLTDEYVAEYHYPARWWGKDGEGKPMEIDLVSMSFDGTSLLVGECKWSATKDVNRLRSTLIAKAKRLPFYNDQVVHPLIFTKGDSSDGAIHPKDVLLALKL